MATSMTHRYIPRIEQTEENLFMEEYYSSTDTKIYMDDMEQSEIAYISYTIQEQLKPVYGYASRTFDDVAIGNRIVTGTFKVPIKNPEAQTPMETIIERSKHSTLESYNDNQQTLMDAVDWITGNIGQQVEDTINEDDETFRYRQKLMLLGYQLDTNSPIATLVQVIKQFQKDHGVEANGKLTESTKYEIDKALNETNLRVGRIYKNTKLRTAPMESAGYRTILETQDIYILYDKYDDGWLYVRTANDGWEGYVNEKEVQIGQ